MDSQYELFRQIGNILLCVAAVIGTTSVVLHLRVPWWRSQMGRHLLAYMAVIALVLDMGVIRLVVGDSWGFALFRSFVFALVPIVMAQRLWLQIKAQRQNRADTTAPDLPR